MERTSDAEIFSKIKKGDEIAFSHLFDTFYTPLCFFSSKYTNDMDLSRSLVQQIFVDLWTKRMTIDVERSLKSYLYTSVKNKSIDYLRQKSRTHSISENIESIDRLKQIPFYDLIEEAELNERINRSINKLPGNCRKIFQLSRFEGMKYLEIASELNISVKTVEMQMGIALKRLRESLSDYKVFNLFSITFLKKK